jgi:phospholipase/carboxylesterase
VSLPEAWIERGGARAIAVGDRESAETVVVLLHGFQMRPEDLAPFAHSLMVPGWFLFPEGPLPAAPDGRAWWHIDPEAREASMARGPRDFAALHPDDLPAARARLDGFLDALEDDLGGRRLVVGGFSQGGMITLDTVLRSRRRVDGLALMSTSRIAFDEWEPLLAAGRVAGLPCLVSHGRADPDLAFGAGDALRHALVAAGAQVTWLPFDGGHELPLVVWRALRRMLSTQRGSTSSGR